MKKSIVLFLMFSLLWIPGVYAAGIPEQKGLVQDEAGMLSTQEVAALTQAASGNLITFHVLTINTLKGEDPSEYAADVYDTWGLSTRDVLLLLSSADHAVELSFINPGLQASLNSWSKNQGGGTGSAAVTGVLDTYFIPYARSDDFAGGISSVMQAVHSISASRGAENGAASGTAGNQSGAASSQSGAVGGAGGNQSGAAGGIPRDNISSGTSSGSLLPRAAIVAGVALVVLLAYVAVSGLRRRKQLLQQQDQFSGLLVRANHALEALKPYQGIVQGKTGEMVEQISKRLSELLVQVSSAANDGQGNVPAFYRLSALKTALAQLHQTDSTYRAAIEEEEQRIAVISEADRNVKQRINELKTDAPELDEQLQAASKETGFELSEIAEDLKELAEETARADQLELFDPIAAQEVTASAQEKQEQIEQDLQDVDLYDDKLDAFPGLLTATRSKIALIIEQNSLHNMKAKPYDNLEEAQARAAELPDPLRKGDMDEVRRIASAMDLLVDEAVAMTERQARLRLSNLQDLETLRSQWGLLQQRRNGLQGRIAEARTRFVEQHVASLADLLEEWSTRLRTGAGELPQVEKLTSDERGEYEQARTALDGLLALQDEAGQQFNQISEGLDSLDERLQKVNRIFTEGQGRVDSTERLLHSRGLASRSRFQLESIPEYGQLEYRLGARPYHLDELEDLARSYDAQISAFVDEANRLIRQKEEQERLAQLARMREIQRREQARKRMSSGPPSSGGFGGGRSSGGSSWGGGGGGRSSGGSSWGGGGRGGGGRSSGGSKW